MNMISTGTFLPEMDASNKQETLAEKFAAVWEMKNSKAARAGGVSLMALSLAACGSSSTTTTASDETASDETASDETAEEETTEEEVVDTTPVVNELALTTAADDNPATTDGADSITGVVSGLSSVRTLDATDTIDGKDGEDSISLTMNSSFGGFTTDSGSMAGVETVNITNATTIARSFDASNITGVTSYVIDASNAAVTLTNLIEAVAITVNDQASGTFSVSFKDVSGTTEDVPGGSEDALTLTMANTGALEDASTTATELKSVTTTINDIEELTLNLSGNNAISLGADDATTLTITGSGVLDLDDVGTGMTSFVGSDFTGDIDVDTTAAGTAAVTALSTGSGDDSVKIDSADFTATATLAGGDGDDTIEYANGAATIKQFTMSGFETVKVTTLASSQVTSAKNWSGVEKIVLMDDIAESGSFVNVGAQAMTIELNGATTEDDVVSSDHTGATTINTVASTATAAKIGTASAAADSNDNDVTAGSSTGAFTMNIGAYTVADGTYSANKATSAVLNIASGLDADDAELSGAGTSFALNANKATSVTVIADGTIDGEVASTGAETFSFEANGAFTTTVLDFDAATSGEITTAKAGTLVVEAEAAEIVSITATKALTVTDTLTAVQELTVDTGAAFVMTNGGLDDIANAILGGSATTSSAQLGTLGDGTNDYDMTISATGLKAGLTLGTSDVADGADIRIDATGATGAITIGDVDNASGDAEVIDIKAGGKALDIGTMDASDDVIVTVTGATTVAIDDIGGTVATADVLLDLEAATGAITLADVSGAAVEIKLAGAIGGVADLGAGNANEIADAITVSKSLTVTLPELEANALIVTQATASTDLTIDVTGGTLADTVSYTSIVTTNDITFKGDLGADTGDSVAIDLEAADHSAGAIIDLTALANYDASAISLSDTVAATVKLGSGSDADVFTINAGAAAQTTITGFDADDDSVNIDALEGATGAVVSITAAGAGTAATIADTAAYLFAAADGAADGIDAEVKADVLAGIAAIDADGAETAGNHTAIFIVTDADSTAVYAVAENAAAIDADSLTLIMTIDDVLAAGDFAM